MQILSLSFYISYHFYLHSPATALVIYRIFILLFSRKEYLCTQQFQHHTHEVLSLALHRLLTITMSAPLIKTIGIVLSHTKYGDASLIVNIYTQDNGKQSFIVSGLSGNKRKRFLPLLMPLSIVELTAYNKPSSTIHRIKEIGLHTPLVNIPFDPVRRSIALFLTELLSRSVKESGADISLFNFIVSSVMALDAGMPGQNSFHLFFMYKLTSLLGFAPDMNDASQPYFNMLEGTFCSTLPMHRHSLASADKELLLRLDALSLENMTNSYFSRSEKHRLMEIMEEYYSLHIANFGQLKSYEVLRTLND